MANKAILSTGLSGFVGTRVSELLTNYTFYDASLNTGVDILDIQSLDNFFKSHPDADTIIHFAGFTSPTDAWPQKGDKNGSCWLLNVEGTRNILSMCQKYNKFLIYISTDYVFDGTKDTPYVETDTPKPLDWYGQTKYEGEKLILDSNHPSAIVRISYPFCAKYDKKIDLTRNVLGKLQRGDVLNPFEDQITTPTFIDDIAYGLEKIIEKKAKGIFHLVASSYQSVYEMVLTIARVFNLDTSNVKPGSLKEYLKTPNIRPYAINAALSNEYTKKTLGIEMHTYEEGLVEMKKQLEK